MTTPVSEPYALAVRTPTSLTPVEPLAAPAPRTGLPALFNADTMSHAGIAAVSLGGLSVFAYAGGLTTSLIAVAALATGAVASRFLGNSGSPTRQLGAALDAERKALNSARGVLEHQLVALQGDRVNLDADRATLAADRESFSERVALEAQRIVAPQLQDLETGRAALAAERAAFEDHRKTATTALEREAADLTADEVNLIHTAAAAYYQTNGRFAPESSPGGHFTSAAQCVVRSDQALVTLVGMGKLVAGVTKQNGDYNWAVPAGGATTITSIAQLRTFLRLATGHSV